MRDVPTDFPTNYLECRSWGHAWKAVKVNPNGRTLQQGLECIRCGGSRAYGVDRRTGEIVSRKPYAYPSDPPYLMPPGTGRLTKRDRGALRAELADRLDPPARPRRRRA